MFVVGVLVSPLFYRVSRAATLAVARSQYVEAALIVRRLGRLDRAPARLGQGAAADRGRAGPDHRRRLHRRVEPDVPRHRRAATGADLGWPARLRPRLPAATSRRPRSRRPSLIMVTVWACNLLADAIRDVSGEAGRALLNTPPGSARSTSAGQPSPSKAGSDDRPIRHRARPRPTAERAAADRPVGWPCATSASTTGSPTARSCTASRFELTPGKVVGIVGESGSGKTLTCRAVLGILPDRFAVSGGSIELAGAGHRRPQPRGSGPRCAGSTISAVFQDPASYLNPSIRVGAADRRGRPGQEAGSAAAQARHRALELLRRRAPARPGARLRPVHRTSCPAACCSASSSPRRSPPTRRS